MTKIYLYVKTHNITGLKYLGKTISKDPYSYKGSGIHWNNHCKKYGYDISTEILKECQNDDELKYWGLYYSKLWNVVESKNWANLIEEAGPGGAWSKQSKLKLSETKKKELSKLSPKELTERMKKSCCSPDSYTPERIEKMRLGMTGKKKTKTFAVLQAEEMRRNRSLEQKMKCGDHNRGKTWKIIEGKRVWISKEIENY